MECVYGLDGQQRSLPLSAADIMTAQPVCLQVNETIEDAIELMLQHDIRHLPVLENGVLVGIVSDQDVREACGILKAPRGDSCGDGAQVSLGDFYSSDVLSVHPDMPLIDLVDLMVEQKLTAVPVIEPAEGRLRGIVSYIDVLRAIREAAACTA